ncbi:hypothetical protein AVEN_173053-1, partial [Araneus ventricosus]
MVILSATVVHKRRQETTGNRQFDNKHFILLENMSNKLVVCPYDEAHKVKESRIQLHITKCRANHVGESTFICPFNATHVLPEQERIYHLSRCSDRAVMERMMAAPMNQNNPFKGRTAVPSYSDPIPVDTDEVWDVEEFGEITPGYRPTKEVPSGAIVQPEPLSKPAIRRQLYRELHQMPSDLDKRSIGAPVPRQPKQPSEAERSFVDEQGAGVQYLGLGRGKPPANRIAANIFSQPPKVGNAAPAQSNYSAAISGMKNLNVGGGVANRAPANQPFLNDDDFPALGLGRGVAKNPQRQELKAPGSR